MDASQQPRRAGAPPGTIRETTVHETVVPADGPVTAPAAADEGIGTLITGLIKDTQDLVRAEVQLAKTELTEDAKTLGAAAAMLVAGALIGLVGLVFLMLFAMYLLADWLGELWLGALIVAAVLLVVAAILAMVGKNRLSAANFKPEQTIDTLKEDQQWAKQQINSVKR